LQAHGRYQPCPRTSSRIMPATNPVPGNSHGRSRGAEITETAKSRRLQFGNSLESLGFGLIRLPTPWKRYPFEQSHYGPPQSVAGVLHYIQGLEDLLARFTEARHLYEPTLHDAHVLVVLRGCAAFRARWSTDSADRRDLFRFLGLSQEPQYEYALWDIVARSETWKRAQDIRRYVRSAVRRRVHEEALAEDRERDRAEPWSDEIEHPVDTSAARAALNHMAIADLADRARLSERLRRRLQLILQDGWDAVTENEREYLVKKLSEA
jgi:hypothetical protein